MGYRGKRLGLQRYSLLDRGCALALVGVLMLMLLPVGGHSARAADDVTVTYHYDTAGGATNENSTIGEAPMVLTDPAARADGAVFGGWYMDPGLSNPLPNSTITAAGSYDLYAKWGITINFNTDGGSVESDVSGVEALAYPALPTPTKNGYRFVEWNTQAGGGGTAVTGGSTTIPSGAGDHTLYAIWTPEYTVTYHNLGGTTNHANNPAVFIASDLDITLESPTARADGAVFGGWFEDADLTTGSIALLNTSKNYDLYAKWGITINFNTDGGSVESDVSGVEALAYPALPTPTKTGCRFVGWNTQADGGGTAVTGGSTTIPSGAGNHTLYAIWAIKDYVVDYVYGTAGGASHANPAAFDAADLPHTLTDPTVRADATFGGWYADTEMTTNPISELNTSNLSTANTTNIHAKWDITIDFNTDGGSVESGVSGVEALAYPALPTPTKTGCRFVGWNTQAGGGGTAVTGGSTTIPSGAGNHTLYAIWAIKTYTVTYEVYGGSAAGPETVNHGDPAPELATTRAGYDFLGWFTAASGGALWTFTDPITSDLTLHAQWDLLSYTIAYTDALGATNPNTTSYTAESIPTIQDLSLPNYHFLGWFTDLSCTTPFVPITTATLSNYALYAKWALDETLYSVNSAPVNGHYGDVIVTPTAPATHVSLDGSTWETSLTLNTEGDYTIYVKEDTGGIQSIGAALSVDKTAPSGPVISYDKSRIGAFFEAITFGLYRAPVTVTVTATDAKSGVESFAITRSFTNGSSSIDLNDLPLTDDGGGTKHVSFIITGSYRGTVTATATDGLGNTTAPVTSDVIFDGDAPEIAIAYTYTRADGTIDNDSADAGGGPAEVFSAGDLSLQITITDDYLDGMQNGLASSVAGKTNASGPYLLVEYCATAGDSFAPASPSLVPVWSDGGTTWQVELTIGAGGDLTDEGIYRVTLAVNDEVGNPAELTSALLYYDTTTPTLEDFAVHAQGKADPYQGEWTNQNVILSGKVTDAVSGIAGAGNGTVWYYGVATGEPSFTVPVEIPGGGHSFQAAAVASDGQFTISAAPPSGAKMWTGSYYVWCYDGAGNLVQDSVAEIKIDKNPPAISASANPRGWTNGNVQISVSASDSESGLQSSDGGRTISGEQDRTYSFSAIDRAGNAASTSVRVSIDTTPPTLTITSSVEGWSNEDVTISISAADTGGSGLQDVLYSQQDNLNSATPVESGSSFRATETGTWYVWARDTAGNVTMESVEVTIDKTAPQFDTPVKQPDGVWSNQDVTVRVGITNEGGSELESVVYTSTGIGGAEGTLNETAEGQFSFIATGEQAAVYTITATDHAKNSATAQTVSINIDKAAPVGSITLRDVDATDIDSGETARWNSLQPLLTFRLWSNNWQQVVIEAEDLQSNEVASGVGTIEYWLYEGDTDFLVDAGDAIAILNEQAIWTTYSGPVLIDRNRQFVVFARVTDLAGNVTHLSSDGIIVDLEQPLVEDSAAPVVTLPVPTLPAEGGVYHSAVTVEFTVSDPIVEGVYSGIGQVGYRVLRGEEIYTEQTLFTHDDTTGEKAGLAQTLGPDRMHLTLPVEIDSNGITVEVTAVDNAGNTTVVTSQPLNIDNTPPMVSVSLDGQPSSDRYFRAPRTAVVTVVDRNFSPELVALSLSGPASPGTWSTAEDGVTHTMPVQFSVSGEYTLSLAVTDLAGHTVTNEQVAYSGSAPNAFVVDLLAPALTAELRRSDGESVERGGYNNTPVTVVLTVTEQNFSAAATTGGVRVTRDGVAIAAPLTWSSQGDRHTASMTFEEDALYTVDVTFADLAGNPLPPFSTERFYIDTAAPEVVVSGIVHGSSNNTAEIAPLVTVSDKYYDADNVLIRLEGLRHGEVQNPVVSRTTRDNGAVYELQGIARDDQYRLTVIATDLAGNTTTVLTAEEQGGGTVQSEAVRFSVNRSGSVFALGGDMVQIAGGYLNQPADVVIVETNVDPLEEFGLTLSKDLTSREVLTEGVHYSVSAATVGGGWSEMTYTVFASNFASDGSYVVALRSVDAAGNISRNDDTPTGAVNFVLDTTPPDALVLDLEAGRIYDADSLSVRYSASDLTRLQEIRVELNGVVIQRLSGDSLTGNSVEGSILIPSLNSAQTLRVVSVDAAGNESSVEGGGVVAGFYITTNPWVRFYANRPLFFASLGGVVLLLGGAAALLFRRMKKRRSSKSSTEA